MNTETDQTLAAALAAARVALAFGQVRRVTRHPDGELESDSTHAVMLSLLAIGVAPLAGLDPGLAAAFAAVHDLPETYGGDTDTSRELTPEEAADKARREAEGLERVCAELAGPVADMLRRYEAQAEPEARLVRVLDKVTPKLAHLLNGGASFVALGLTAEHVRANHARQRARLAAEYPEPALAPAHELLAAACVAVERGLVDGTVRASVSGRPARTTQGPRTTRDELHDALAHLQAKVRRYRATLTEMPAELAAGRDALAAQIAIISQVTGEFEAGLHFGAAERARSS